MRTGKGGAIRPQGGLRPRALRGLIGGAVMLGACLPSSAETLTFDAGCDAGERITIAAVGDILFHKKLQIQAYAKNGTFSRFWKPVEPLLKAADLTYGNLESPSAHGVSRWGRNAEDTGRRYGNVYSAELKPLLFNVHPSAIGELADSGFDVLSTANNHAFDRGSLGVDRTIENLETYRMPFTGSRKRDETGRPWSTVTRARGISVAWLACTYAVNVPVRGSEKQVLRCYQDKDQVLEEIARRRSEPDVDAVILVPHWGFEDHHEVIRRQRVLAREALEAGAVAVIGSHPHVVQGWEKHETEDGAQGLIIYSTGNFISNQRRLMQRSGIIALVELVKRTDGATRVSAAGFVPTWVAIDGNVNHRVLVNSGKDNWPRQALQATRKLLPEGNLVETGTEWPVNLPRNCPDTR